MTKVKLNCKSCGKEVEREEKPAPKTKAEAKQILFNCPHCGATNLRDGSAYYAAKKTQKKAIKPAKPAPGPALPPKETPAPPAQEPEKEETNDEETDGSPTII